MTTDSSASSFAYPFRWKLWEDEPAKRHQRLSCPLSFSTFASLCMIQKAALKAFFTSHRKRIKKFDSLLKIPTVFCSSCNDLRNERDRCWHKIYEKASKTKNVNDIALTVYYIALIMHCDHHVHEFSGIDKRRTSAWLPSFDITVWLCKISAPLSKA